MTILRLLILPLLVVMASAVTATRKLGDNLFSCDFRDRVDHCQPCRLSYRSRLVPGQPDTTMDKPRKQPILNVPSSVKLFIEGEPWFTEADPGTAKLGILYLVIGHPPILDERSLDGYYIKLTFPKYPVLPSYGKNVFAFDVYFPVDMKPIGEEEQEAVSSEFKLEIPLPDLVPVTELRSRSLEVQVCPSPSSQFTLAGNCLETVKISIGDLQPLNTTTLHTSTDCLSDYTKQRLLKPVTSTFGNQVKSFFQRNAFQTLTICLALLFLACLCVIVVMKTCPKISRKPEIVHPGGIPLKPDVDIPTLEDEDRHSVGSSATNYIQAFIGFLTYQEDIPETLETTFTHSKGTSTDSATSKV